VTDQPLIKANKELTRRTAKGFFWLLGKTGVITVTKIVFLMVLARLLVPEEFGLVSMAAVVSTLVANFARLGVAPAIVQRPELTEGHRVAGFYIGLLLGLVAAAFLLTLAEPIAYFVQMDGLAPLLQIIAVVPLISSVAQVPKGMLERDLRFREIALIETLSFTVSQAFIAIPLALAGWGAEAQVWAFVVATVITTVLEMWRSAPLIRLTAPLSCFGDVIRFGSGVSAASMSQTLAYNIDNFLIGKFLGAEALGIYGRAFQVLTMPTKLFGAALSNVLFPAMAAVQDDRKRLSRAFLQSLGLTAMVSLPASAFLVVLAPELVWVILGPQWGGVVIPFQLLALAILARVGNKICDSLIRATGAVSGLAWRQATYAASVGLGAYLGHFFKLEGAAVGVVCAIFLNFWIMLTFSIRLAVVPVTAVASILLRYIAIAVVFGGSLWGLAESLRAIGDHPLIVLTSAVGLAGVMSLSIIRFTPGLLGEEINFIRRLRSNHKKSVLP